MNTINNLPLISKVPSSSDLQSEATDSGLVRLHLDGIRVVIEQINQDDYQTIPDGEEERRDYDVSKLREAWNQSSAEGASQETVEEYEMEELPSSRYNIQDLQEVPELSNSVFGIQMCFVLSGSVGVGIPFGAGIADLLYRATTSNECSDGSASAPCPQDRIVYDIVGGLAGFTILFFVIYMIFQKLVNCTQNRLNDVPVP